MAKKIVSLLLSISLLVGIFASLISCDNSDDKARLLSFSQAQSIEEMKKLDGKTVSIIGYMSTLSPISGKFMYLMNLPYQSCPFCVPNTTELANTIAVYAKSGEFEFTDRAIQVVGVLEFGDFEDEFGYVYSYRIKDARYTILDTTDMSDELKLWQQLASTDVISDIYSMYEYVNFLCCWSSYTMQFTDGKDYLYPEDAKTFITVDGKQYNYGFKDGYFDKIISTVEGVDREAFADLVSNIREAQQLAEDAYAELDGGKYYVTSEYSGAFGDGRTQYRLEKAHELESRIDALYRDFSAWLSTWEL